ncbi:elongator subunit iki1 domain-containing protein [Hirsutella rhossiliensis]|uniref:Elongator complex protein 5 n=1 Tax=Hirsutella rhossiliensis TaxID=111463 RepID=A0A9P8SNN6_9HYPO|nr:elongator subunit iki1 domain-containing protein [Hirsutella rhossiliensis]KAH0968075.1 elongator subunit iki1 domain-containing protein [Hirsutella rhossiliensis]
MASAGSHARSHSLLLLQKMLNLRDAASPLTLVLDTLEQTARPLLLELYTRAKISKTKVILVSLTTVKKPRGVHVLVRAAGRDLKAVRQELMAHYPAAHGKPKPAERAVVVVDSLNSMATADAGFLAAFLSSILTPAVSIVAVYHADVPVILPKASNEYEPAPLTILCHLATAILRLSSLQQEVERQRARNRALQEPEWGLKEEREGVIIGLRGSVESEGGRGLVIDMELRRRSGRTVSEKFILTPGSSSTGPGRVSLLTDHAMFAASTGGGGADGDEGEEGPESTFDLGLTEKQRKDREGIVLPYFDAQTDIGAGEGGRILYDMGREDDFDDEEDEI